MLFLEKHTPSGQYIPAVFRQQEFIPTDFVKFNPQGLSVKFLSNYNVFARR